MTSASRVAAVLVTHDCEHVLEPTLASIDGQSRAADIRIAVDDNSVDRTRGVLAEHGFDVEIATSSASDVITRIAQNFQQALRSAVRAGADVVVLGDHDDVWHLDRIEHQVQLLDEHPSAAMVAGDGFLIDEHGAAIAGTLRETFPVPQDFDELQLRTRIAYALRHSIATGGASALRPANLADWTVPPGWLHDRWWSLAALRADRFVLDDTAVIDYRLSPGQQVGLDTGAQESAGRWFVKKARDAGSTAARARDLARLLRR